MLYKVTNCLQSLLICIFRPLMKYIGKSHNLWHRMALGLEQMAFDPSTLPKPSNSGSSEFDGDQTKTVSRQNHLFEYVGSYTMSVWLQQYDFFLYTWQ